MSEPPVPTRPTRAARAARAVAWTVVGGGLVALVGIVAFFLAMRFDLRRNVAQVPDVTGARTEDAEATLARGGLTIEVVGERHDPNVASGRVIQQEPTAGAEVRPGRKVRVIVSLGGAVAKIPDVVGRSVRSVDIELRREGLFPGDEARIPDARGEGTILAQVPPAGGPGVAGARVSRLVSDGPHHRRFVMPDLAGRSQAAVERWIEASGFRRGAVRRLSVPDRPPGTVVGQLPLAGYPIRSRDVVELTVAE